MISRKRSWESQTGRSGRQSSQGSVCSTACSFRRSRSDWGAGRAPPSYKSMSSGPGPRGTGWATSSTQGPWQGAGRGDKSGAMGEGVQLCRSGDSQPLRWEGLWHKRWHPGFQGPRQGAMLLPALRGETGERCAPWVGRHSGASWGQPEVVTTPPVTGPFPSLSHPHSPDHYPRPPEQTPCTK